MGNEKIFFSCEKRTKMAKNKGFLNGKTRSILCRMTIFMKKGKRNCNKFVWCGMINDIVV